MKKQAARRSGLALVMVAATAAVVPVVTATTPAQALAPGLDPDNRLGSLTLDKSSGEISYAGGPQRLTTDRGCPEGYRNSSRVLFVWSDGTWPLRNSASDTGLPATVVIAGSPIMSGLDGNPVARDNTSGKFASRWNGGGFPGNQFDGHSGTATYLVTCDPGAAPSTTFPSATDGVGTSKYFSVDIRITWDDALNQGTWEVDSGTPTEKTDTTTTLTPTARNDGSVMLTAALSPAEATGQVTFTDVTTGSTVDTATLQGGSASAAVSGLQPGTQHTFRATYAGDSRHKASTSNDAVVTTVSEPTPPQDTDITVTIPAANSALQFTTTAGGVSMGSAFVDSGELAAHGTLGQVRVTDNRTVKARWSLNGQASPLVKQGDAATTIPASALGWTPRLVSTGGVIGPPVAPGSNGGLSSSKVLVSQPDGATAVATIAEAQIDLRVPQTTAPGSYTSTLTLTLL